MRDILGILVSQKKLDRSLILHGSRDLQLYHMYGSVLGLDICFFSVNGIDLENKRIRGYSFDSDGNFSLRNIAIPKVIHNRTIHSKIADIRKIRKLRRSGDTVLYNPVCSHNWENIYGMLKSDRPTAGFLLRSLKAAEDLDQFEGRPYVIHMTMQKDGKGEWGSSGVVGRVFKDNQFSGKASAVRVEGEMQHFRTLEKLGKRAAAVLENFIPHLAEIGMSFSLSSSGRVYLTNVQFFDTRIWYKQANEIAMWETTYRKSVEYGLHLLSHSSGSEKHDYSHLSS